MQFKYFALSSLAATASGQMMNLTSALMSTPDLANLTTYVSLFPDIVSTLSQAQNITILAPSNEAFTKLLAGPMGAAVKANDTDLIQAVLTYHVLNGSMPSSMITDQPTFVPTMLMDPAYSNVTGGQVVEAVKMGNDVMIFSGLHMNSTVTKADMNFTGGVIHIIDTVLTPPQNISTTAVAADLTAAAGALTNADLVDALDMAMDVTVFAPNNDAFKAIGSALPNLTMDQLAGILEYHVINGTVAYSSIAAKMDGMSIPTMGGGNVTIHVDGSDIFVNSAKVVLPDVLVANGVVHVIDNVLNPNATSATPMPSATMQMPAFAGASSASDVALTSGIPAPTMALSGTEQTGAAGGGSSGGSASSAAGTAMQTAAATGAASPMKNGAMGMAALFGAGAAFIV